MSKFWKVIIWLVFWPVLIFFLIWWLDFSKAMKVFLTIAITVIFTLAAMIYFQDRPQTERKMAVVRRTSTPELLIAPKATPTKTPIISYWIKTLTAVPNYQKDEIIKINGKTSNQYSQMITTNAGTENQLTRLCFFVPYGTYIVKNMRNYIDQFNVYSQKTRWDGNVEYPADGQAYLFQPGESKSVIIPNSYYVYVSPDSTFELNKNLTNKSASTSAETIHIPKNIYSPTPDQNRKNNGTCKIKGNRKTMIYHCKNSPNYYDLTDYTWFCTPAEAEAAGYRMTRNIGYCQY